MIPARITLLRHAHTAANGLYLDAKMSGWADLPLSALGRQQVVQLRERLADESPFDAIYSSPLQRACHTAQGVQEVCGEPIHLMNDLRELNCGTVDGLPLEYVRQSYPAEWRENLRQENPDFRWPGGESYHELRERCVRALDTIAGRHPGERVLVATHCGFITQIAGVIHGKNAASWESFRVENTSLSEVLWSESVRSITSFNDFRHLQRSAVNEPIAA